VTREYPERETERERERDRGRGFANGRASHERKVEKKTLGEYEKMEKRTLPDQFR